MRKRGRTISTLAEMPHLFEFTDALVGSTHLVTNDAVEAGRRLGRYPAVCGAVVLAASLLAPADRYCRACLSRVAR